MTLLMTFISWLVAYWFVVLLALALFLAFAGTRIIREVGSSRSMAKLGIRHVCSRLDGTGGCGSGATRSSRYRSSS